MKKKILILLSSLLITYANAEQTNQYEIFKEYNSNTKIETKNLEKIDCNVLSIPLKEISECYSSGERINFLGKEWIQSFSLVNKKLNRVVLISPNNDNKLDNYHLLKLSQNLKLLKYGNTINLALDEFVNDIDFNEMYTEIQKNQEIFTAIFVESQSKEIKTRDFLKDSNRLVELTEIKKDDKFVYRLSIVNIINQKNLISDYEKREFNF